MGSPGLACLNMCIGRRVWGGALLAGAGHHGCREYDVGARGRLRVVTAARAVKGLDA